MLSACMQFLKHMERAHLLKTVALAIVTDSHLVTTIRMISGDDISSLLQSVGEHAGKEELKRMAVSLAQKLPEKTMAVVMRTYPSLANLRRATTKPAGGYLAYA